jgi:hypothetical protein
MVLFSEPHDLPGRIVCGNLDCGDLGLSISHQGTVCIAAVSIKYA